MANGRAKFRQVDVTRALKGAAAAGYDDARVEITPEGCVVVIVGKAAAAPAHRNSFDELLR
jgi:hypothetical protein